MFDTLLSKVIGCFGLLAVVGGLLAVVHHRIYKEGYTACNTAHVQAVQKGEQKYEQTTEAVQKLDDADLRRQLCQFVRDAKPSVCIKTLTPFSP